ncbi:hypothetical protein [Actinacidiphila reveromycinica]|uniref:hypothetical protein n=1 Tax=Actinacidiphila reveromycinica TaxID=659352 RepID=UPI001921326D|nr:hypothetical protein [Streptomyces sp. SN-593]
MARRGEQQEQNQHDEDPETASTPSGVLVVGLDQAAGREAGVADGMPGWRVE